MPTTTQDTTTTTYRIEVSGWDKSDSFFVESADLEWSEESGKRVRMLHDMRDGAVVFVRLIQGPVPANNYPVPYLVEAIETSSNGSPRQFRLIQLHPRR